MKRRDFLRSAALGVGGIAFAAPGSRVYAAPEDYTGRFLVSLQLTGGWDVTSFCDPKINPTDGPVINNWASAYSSLSQLPGSDRLRWAPFASNERLFSNHFRKMLVINGVDAQTNSHSTGIIYNHSGANAAGQPTLTALFAAAQETDLPLAYVNNGGFVAAEGLIRFSRLDRIGELDDVLDPVSSPGEAGRPLRRASDINRIQAYQAAAMQRRLQRENLTPLQRENLNAYLSARSNRDSLLDFRARLPTEANLQPDVTLPGVSVRSSLLPQIQLALLAFQSGVGVAADLQLRGFDTHSNHDAEHRVLFEHVADAIDYFWSFAAELGVADRITMVIGSDFSRTPRYNSGGGKDHWPIGSYVVMENNPAWGNRAVGLTDEGHHALRINPTTLARDDANGILLRPEHVHQALRRYLGLEAFAQTQSVVLPPTDNVEFFRADRWS